MIFVTVGVQLPFDRLIRTVDDWAGRHGRRDVLAQVGESTYVPRHVDARARLSPDEFRDLIEGADLVVAHAGMGSIITALELGKPIIIMPRRAALGEHRNDHQLATARRMASQETIRVADDERALARMLDESDVPDGGSRISPHANEDLLARIVAFIEESPARGRRGFRYRRR